MEETERNLNENEIESESAPSADATETVQAAEETVEETVTEALVQTENNAESELPVATDETAKEVSEPVEKPETPLYSWNYDTQKKLDLEKSKAKRGKAAVIYAAVMTAAFLISFAVLLVLLLTNSFDSATPEPSPAPSGNGTATSVVYVKEYSPESGVLTTQEIYTRSLPSIVSISVANSSSSGVGSGFIISEDGYIVTANHVVSGMEQITVILSNNESYAAKVIDGNEFTDLALIKIEKTGLPALKIGSSSALLVGDHVVAIGTPAAVDFAGSLADGTVSFNNRIFKIYNEDGSVDKKMTLIQTNALVNPGNSGCPLINQYGEVVGIVTMKLNSTYFEGMCFAIPTDYAMPIINAMKNGENYEALLSAVSQYPAKLGITGETAQVSNNDVYGVRINSFSSSSYDVSRKMNTGDIITQVDSTVVTSISDLSRALDKYKPGDTIKITFYRSTQKMTVDVTLGK